MSVIPRDGIPLPVVQPELLASPAPASRERVVGVPRTQRSAPASWARFQVRARRLTDLSVVLVSTAASIAVAHLTPLGDAAEGTPFRGTGMWVFAIAFVVIWFGALRIHRGSEIRTVGHTRGFRRLTAATASVFALLAVVNAFAPVDGLRAYVLVGFPLGVLLLAAGRVFWQRRLDADRAVGLSLPRALIVGAGPDIDFVAEQLGRVANPKYVVAGVVFSDGTPNSGATTATGFPTFDGIDAVTDAIAIANADVVIIAGAPGDGGAFIRALSWRLESSPAELVLAWCLDSVDQPRLRFDTANGLPLTHIAAPTFSGGKHRVKRVMDVLLAGGALIVLAPVFAVIAVMVRRDSAGPVFFRQERVGLDGRRFQMIKFRSMVVTAEADLAGLVDQSDGNGVMFKLRADPRVTKIGAVLRRYSLDELPQLWNIFRGDMSLVGPRPPLVREVEQYDSPAERRLYVKPGLTGAWQVSGRSDLTWEQSVRLDLHYVENWSVLGDLRIMWRTVSVVIKPVGAY